MQTLIQQLFELGAIQFGTFTLKSGIVSPFYIDLRLAISAPKLLGSIAEAIGNATKTSQYDCLCGVPYTAIPFATALSIRNDVPMILKRKEKKSYGTGKMVEGIFQAGQTCLIIEDIITSGQSILETVDALQREGLIVRDIAVLIDREQGGKQFLEAKGYRVHPVLTLSEMTQSLINQGKIDAAQANALHEFQRRSAQSPSSAIPASHGAISAQPHG